MRFFILLSLFIITPSIAYADCANPVHKEGTVIYNKDYKVAQFCNGTDWIGMAGGSSSDNGTSESPTHIISGSLIDWPIMIKCPYTGNRKHVLILNDYEDPTGGNVYYNTKVNHTTQSVWVSFNSSTGVRTGQNVIHCPNLDITQQEVFYLGGGGGSTSSGEFGDPVSMTTNTEHIATTDGIVTFRVYAANVGNGICDINGSIGGTIITGDRGQMSVGNTAGSSFPVKKGATWKITTPTDGRCASVIIHFTPLSGGSGGDGTTPSGAVMSFNLATCPAGWNEYTAARGRFIRGIDSTGTIDPDGVRVVGSVQEDEFKSHVHGSGVGGVGSGYGNGIYWNKNPILPFNTNPTGGAETRPKNIALLFCEKD